MTTTEVTATASIAARMDNGAKIYGEGDTEVRALDGVTAQFESGVFTAIMGPSGSGKSTLLHTLAGLDVLTDGQVHIGDTELGSLSDKALTLLRRKKVGFVFQAYNLVPVLTARENVEFVLELQGVGSERTSRAMEILDQLGLSEFADRRPNEMSGGQQQRVAVARALASQPEIIFADEPTGNLDSTTGAEILDFMRRAVREFGQTIVMVTHDPNAASYADRVVFVADGKLDGELVDPTSDEIFERMKHLGH